MAVRHATHNRVDGQQLWLDAICMVTTRKNLANVENDSAAVRLRWGCVLKGGGALARVVVLALDFTVVVTEPDCVQDCEPHIGCTAKRQAGSRRFVLFCSRVWQMLLSSSSGKDEQMTLSHVIYAFDEQCWVHSILFSCTCISAFQRLGVAVVPQRVVPAHVTLALRMCFSFNIAVISTTCTMFVSCIPSQSLHFLLGVSCNCSKLNYMHPLGFAGVLFEVQWICTLDAC